MRTSGPDYIALIRAHLTPDLLAPKLRKQWKPGLPPTWGHCYVATKALYYLYGRDNGYKACHLKVGGEVSHWFLRNPEGTVIDPTWDQFDFPLPYWRGIGSGFMTFSPSKRTKILLTRIGYGRLAESCQVMRGNA